MTNNHYQKNHSSGGASKGFYIALGVCLIAIGVAAWTTYDSVINYATPEEEPSSSQTTAYPANEAVSGVLEVPGSSSPGTTSSTPSAPPSTSPSSQAPQSKAPVSSEEPAVKTTTVPLSFSYPVDGTVVQKFSIDDLIYSKTMKDWRAHAGVDFAAELGTEVKAIADGTVKNAYHDDLFGNVVYIEHGETGGCYCGLETMDVKAGDTVKAGQKIGTVGTTPCESADDPHLHFAVKKSGKWIDPLTIFE